MTKAAETQSVLDSMTAGIMGRKTEKAAKLTKVGAEVVPTHVLPKTDAMFPNDVPEEAIVGAIRNIRHEVGQIMAALDAVEEHLGKAADSAPVVDLDAERKRKEREADERVAERVTTPETEAIKARLAELSSDAKEQTFSPVIAAAKEAAEAGGGPREVMQAAMAADGWTCPEHGFAKVELTRKGREYRVCPEDGCQEFERL